MTGGLRRLNPYGGRAGTTVPALRSALGLVLTGGLTVSAASAQTTASRQPPASTPLVLRGVTVIDVRDGRRLRGQTVSIVGRHIHRVGRAGAVPIPSGARIIDARGKYLIPGLWDMFVKINSSPLGGPVGAPEKQLLRLVAHGVTGIRDGGSAVPLDARRRWRQEIGAGTRVGPPRQLLSGGSIDWPDAPHVDEADLRRTVDSLVAAGADMLMVDRVPSAAFAIVAAEARRLGMPMSGQASSVTPLEASALGARFIDYQMGGTSCWNEGGTPAAPLVDFEACQRSLEQFQQHDTWFVPTIFMGPQDSARTAALVEFGMALEKTQGGATLRPTAFRELLRTIAASGPAATVVAVASSPVSDSLKVLDLLRRELPLLAGSNAYAGEIGFQLHVELALLVRWGWSPLGVLRAATFNPATALHATDSLGTVEAGKLADVVLLDADPLADIGNTAMIHAVIADGRFYDRVRLNRLLAASKL